MKAVLVSLLVVALASQALASHDDRDASCPDVEQRGSEALTLIVSDANSGESFGDEVPAGSDVRIDAVARVSGRCEIWSHHPVTKTCYRSSGPFERRITGMVGRHVGPTGRGGRVREFPIDAQGRTTRVGSMDSRDDERTSDGPVILHRDVEAGEYVDTVTLRIHATPCDLLPDSLSAQVRFRVTPVGSAWRPTKSRPSPD